MKKAMVVLSVLAVGAWGHADELSDMRKEIEQLKRDVAELRQMMQGAPKQGAAAEVDRRAGIRKKSAEERKIYNAEQLREIEALYQLANKSLDDPGAKVALKSLIEKYPKANRTGCAVQYIGQMASGDEKEKYLKLAIKDFGDCFYGNGVQVGAYARYYLGYYYKEKGKAKESQALFDEIRNDYPDAVNHKGRLLVELLPK